MRKSRLKHVLIIYCPVIVTTIAMRLLNMPKQEAPSLSPLCGFGRMDEGMQIGPYRMKQWNQTHFDKYEDPQHTTETPVLQPGLKLYEHKIFLTQRTPGQDREGASQLTNWFLWGKRDKRKREGERVFFESGPNSRKIMIPEPSQKWKGIRTALLSCALFGTHGHAQRYGWKRFYDGATLAAAIFLYKQRTFALASKKMIIIMIIVSATIQWDLSLEAC